jgi:hypothetical protein
MKIASCKKLYDVRFKKVFVSLPRTGTGPNSASCNNGKIVFDTVCVISEEDQNKRGPERFAPVAEGIAYMSPKDKYNRWTGKKVALGMALAQLSADYPTRVVFWDSFFKNFPKAKS